MLVTIVLFALTLLSLNYHIFLVSYFNTLNPRYNVWFFDMFETAENTDKYDLDPDMLAIYSGLCLLIIMMSFLYIFRKNLINFSFKMFSKILANNYMCLIICSFCYFIFQIKAFFHEYNNGLTYHYILTIGNITFLINLRLNPEGFLGRPEVWMFFLLTLRLILISLEHFAINILDFMAKYPEHMFSQRFQAYLIKKKK